MSLSKRLINSSNVFCRTATSSMVPGRFCESPCRANVISASKPSAMFSARPLINSSKPVCRLSTFAIALHALEAHLYTDGRSYRLHLSCSYPRHRKLFQDVVALRARSPAWWPPYPFLYTLRVLSLLLHGADRNVDGGVRLGHAHNPCYICFGIAVGGHQMSPGLHPNVDPLQKR
eukprot:scaffold1703_cov252-Pinguiococcus_pyrenoidosus.AAC.1